MSNRCFHVITGASGAGKSTLVSALGDLGYSTVPEAGRAIVQEQLACSGSLLPWVDRPAFMDEMLARSIQEYRTARSLKAPVFFDRGIPECLAWLRLLGLRVKPQHEEAAVRYRYADPVFVAEPWSEIYVRDRMRQASFERAARSFEATVAAYTEAGYRACIIPKAPVQERVAFVLARMEAGT